MSTKKKKKQHAYREKKSAWKRLWENIGDGAERLLTPRRWHFNVLYLFLSCVVIALVGEWISKGDSSVTEWTWELLKNNIGAFFSWFAGNLVAFFAGVLLIFLLGMVLYCLCNSTGFTVLFLGVLYCGLSAANWFKMVARNEPLLPWDFILIGAAAEFVDDAGLTITPQVIIAFSTVGILTLGAFLLNKRFGKAARRAIPVWRGKLVPRLVSAAIALALFLSFFYAFFIQSGWRRAMGIEVNSWNQVRDYSNYGVVPMLAVNGRYMLVEKPAGYSRERVQEIAEETRAASADRELNGENPTPNIIVVMYEAFGDANLLKNFTYSKNVTETIDWLKDHSVNGMALTSIFGGGTSITEFMVLTGMSNAWLPPACTPYQQYVNDALPAYPSFLRDDLGYDTIAVHPYGAAYWNRNVAYPNMGIDRFLSKENCFATAERCRLCRYVTDSATVDQIIDTFEEHRSESDKPLFLHAVTIQNHQAYHPDEYSEEELVHVESTEPLSEELQISWDTYVTGLYQSDQSMRKLIDYFETVEEPTILLIFGDHWGKTGTVDDAYVPAGLFDEGTLYSSHENVRRAYSVPFYIWDNYRGLTGEVENLSAYQLIPLLTEKYGLARPLYFDYLAQQLKVFRGNYSNTTLDAKGEPSGKKSSATKDAMEKMQILQYDLLFGKKYLYD